jgi:hypothetical protein
VIDSYLTISVSLFISIRYPCATFFKIIRPYSCLSHLTNHPVLVLSKNTVSVENLACISALTSAGVLLAFTTGKAQGLAKEVAILDTTADDALEIGSLGPHDEVAYTRK